MNYMKIVFTVISVSVIIAIGWSVIEWFAKNGTRNNSDPRIREETFITHMTSAVDHQDTAMITALAKDHPEWLNYQEPKGGITFLIRAVGTEKYKSAEALLQCGADPDIQTTYSGETALYVAAGYSWVDHQAKKDPKYVKLLLKYSADPNINYVGVKYTDGISRDITESGTSPLMRSIGCGIEKTKALVEGGANLNYKTSSGSTAAIMALMAGQNATERGMEYAHYLIALQKAKVTDPYCRGELFSGPDEDTNVKFYPVNLLRDWNPSLNSRGYQIKMEIVKEFKRQGVNIP